MKTKMILFTLIYGALLTGLTIYVLLDSFVIPRRYAPVREVRAENAEIVDPDGAEISKETKIAEDREERPQPAGSREKEDGAPAEEASETGDGHRHKDWPEGAAIGRKMPKPPAEAGRNDSVDRQSSETADAEEDAGVNADNQEIPRTYHDDGADITLQQYRVKDTNVYVADVKLSSPDRLKTALAEDTYGRNITEETSVMADNNKAVLAINGDYYGSRQTGYVIREGVLYRDKKKSGNEDLVILKNGEFLIINEDDITAQELLDKGAWQVFSFGPALVTDGEVAVEANEEVGKAMQSNPRTAIGVIDDLHYVFVVADGRTSENAGLALHDLADFMKDLGAATAYNLDGGGSSAMIFEGEVINNPTTSGRQTGERKVSDIVYIR
ncbi:MAG: phosphodiester glycosidase family protein [Lachnospiraceae bacterium]|nr:phosphodiester glycosidase family protein [Lachnospiraceae bacterium]